MQAKTVSMEVMRRSETELQMVTRHVREGEAILERQRALVAKLKAQVLSTVLAEIILDSFEISQTLHTDHLKRLQLSS